MDWSKLKVLYYVVKAGSYSKAAKLHKIDQPALTYKISALEKEIGYRLINRSTPQKPLSLTRRGQVVFETAEQMFNATLAMDTELKKEELKGRVRISTTHAIGNYIIAPLLSYFTQKYPDIQVELICNDKQIDVFDNRVDISIAPYIDDNHKLIQNHFITLNSGIYGTPEYLEKFGTPLQIEDLDKHRLIVFARPEESPYSEVNWLLKVGREGREPRKAFYTSNSTANILDMSEKGNGLITFYEAMHTNRESKLIRVLEDLKGPTYNFFLAHPEKPEYIDRIQLLKDFLMENINKNTVT